MIKEHERTALTVDLPEHGLLAGDIGVVVHIYPDAKAYELEIFAADGSTLDVVTVGTTRSGHSVAVTYCTRVLRLPN